VGRFGADWPLTVAVVAAAAGLLVALFLLMRIAIRLRTAFAERLHALPGARWWRRLRHGTTFWVGVVVHVAIALVLVVYIVSALRFLVRIGLT
jgi:hypothetical protein